MLRCGPNGSYCVLSMKLATLKLREESIIFHVSYSSKVVCDLEED